MRKIETLAAAIMKHEGFTPNSHSWQNNNPGNLRASPYAPSVVGGFAVFPEFWLGFYALTWDLHAKCVGNTVTGLGPTSTLADLITVWAPSADGNNTEAYILDVCTYLSLDRSTPLSYFTT